MPLPSFSDFLITEQRNLDRGLSDYPDELAAIRRVDGLYLGALQAALDRGRTETELSLLAFSHANFYIALASILRDHFATSFSLVRVAIDASFIAYRLISNDGTVAEYHQEEDSFKFVKKHVKKLPGTYPKAAMLILLYEACSNLANHAGPKSLDNRSLHLGERLYFGMHQDRARISAALYVFACAHALILNVVADYLVDRVSLWGPRDVQELSAVMDALRAKLRNVLPAFPQHTLMHPLITAVI